MKLANNCICSEITVYPTNWKSGGSSLLKKVWYVQYYFRDPLFKDRYPNGKQIKIKGFTKFKTLEERREAITIALAELTDLLKNQDYNPITKTRKEPTEAPSYEIDPSTPWIDALDSVYGRLKVSKGTLKDMKCVVKNMRVASSQLRYDHLSISEIRRKHIKICLEHLQNTIPNTPVKKGQKPRTWGAPSFNRHRSLLMSMFKELLDLEAIETDPVSSLKKQDELPNERETLTPHERKIISAYLKEKHYPFWRFIQIFSNSGSRISELMRLQVKDVNLESQTFKTVIEKGRKAKRQIRTIKNVVVAYWAELMDGASPEDFLFSRGLVPGANMIKPYQVTYRWERHVKNNQLLKSQNDGKSITADLYSIKHLKTDETVEQAAERLASELALEIAAEQNGHTTTAMVRRIYAKKGEDLRQHERLKKLGNEF